MTVVIHLKDTPYEMAEDFSVCVTDYDEGDWDGSGWALTLTEAGSVWEWNLTHCSCYGPFEKGPSNKWDSFAAFLIDSESVTSISAPVRLVRAFIEAVQKEKR